MNGISRLLALTSAAIATVWAQETPTQPSNDGNTGTIEVTVEQLRSDLGGLMVHLYLSEDGFPDKPDKASVRLYVTPDGRTARATFPNLPYQTYAVAVCHDENANKDCDSNFLGIPKEGVGVSNNAKGFMGPPKFKDSQFELNSPSEELSVTLDY